MNCKSCGKTLLVESLGDGKRKLKCESCGTSEVLDQKDRKYLTSDLPPVGKPLLG